MTMTKRTMVLMIELELTEEPIPRRIPPILAATEPMQQQLLRLSYTSPLGNTTFKRDLMIEIVNDDATSSYIEREREH